MVNYLDLTKYNDREILAMLKEKQREYMLLIQSEIMAKMILNHYGLEFFTSTYHSRVNKEQYLIYECAKKRNLLTKDLLGTVSFGIPTNTIIERLIESCDELKCNDNPDYFNYSRSIDSIRDDIKYYLAGITVMYKDGYLYFVNENNDYELITNESLKRKFSNEKQKTL